VVTAGGIQLATWGCGGNGNEFQLKHTRIEPRSPEARRSRESIGMGREKRKREEGKERRNKRDWIEE